MTIGIEGEVFQNQRPHGSRTAFKLKDRMRGFVTGRQAVRARAQCVHNIPNLPATNYCLHQKVAISRPLGQFLRIIGRGDRIRTCDPLFPKQMRYQAALLPDREGRSVVIGPNS